MTDNTKLINDLLDSVGLPDRGPVAAQAAVFAQCLRIYAERNERYNDNWVRMGWRGPLFRIRERAERLWDNLFNRTGDVEEIELDDAYDLINFAGFLVRGARGEATRDGEWW